MVDISVLHYHAVIALGELDIIRPCDLLDDRTAEHSDTMDGEGEVIVGSTHPAAIMHDASKYLPVFALIFFPR